MLWWKWDCCTPGLCSENGYQNRIGKDGNVHRLIVIVILVWSVVTSLVAAPTEIWFTKDQDHPVTLRVDLFLSSTCPHCAKADAFFQVLQRNEPGLTVHRHMINQDLSALKLFSERLQEQHSNRFVVPGIVFCDSLWTGFLDNHSTGKVLRQALHYCRKKIKEDGQLTPDTVRVLQKWGGASQFQINTERPHSSFGVVILSALGDSVTPCSFFIFLAFLAFLECYPAHKRWQALMGIVFLTALGVIHYLQQVQSVFYYSVVLPLRWPAALSGMLLLFFVLGQVIASPTPKKGRVPLSYFFLRGYQQMMPHHRRLMTTVFVLFVLCCTVVFVYVHQETCFFNMALVWNQWLMEQAFSPLLRYVYQMLYQIVYLLPLSLWLLIYLKGIPRYRKASFWQVLTIVSRVILVSIAIILLVFPSGLANAWLSFGVLVGGIIMGCGMRAWHRE